MNISAFSQLTESGWNSEESSTLMDLTFSASVPYGEFSNNTTSIGFGLAGGYFFPFSKDLPLYLGVEAGYTLKGTHTEHIYQKVDILAGNSVLDVLPIQMDLETRNEIWNMFISVRYIIPLSMIRPYIDPKIGFNYLTTKTSIYDRTSLRWLSGNEDDLISTSKQISSFVLAYGAEAGFIIPLNATTALKMGLSYIVGGVAEYYDESQISNWNIVYTGSNYNASDLRSQDFSINEDAIPHRSATDLYRIHFGLSMNIR
jgi:hypothetical protein